MQSMQSNVNAGMQAGKRFAADKRQVQADKWIEEEKTPRVQRDDHGRVSMHARALSTSADAADLLLYSPACSTGRIGLEKKNWEIDSALLRVTGGLEQSFEDKPWMVCP